MIDIGFVKKSTFILTIIILIIIFSISIFCIIMHYENKDMKVNIPTVVQDNNDINSNLNELHGITIEK